jgi:NADH-quinone oxidoreductase subunit H
VTTPGQVAAQSTDTIAGFGDDPWWLILIKSVAIFVLLLLLTLFNIVFAGVAFVLYGLAVALSDRYPRWLGWVVVVAGVGSVAAGLVQAAAGESTALTRVLTIIFPTVITLWLIEMGVLVLRKASAEPDVAA